MESTALPKTSRDVFFFGGGGNRAGGGGGGGAGGTENSAKCSFVFVAYFYFCNCCSFSVQWNEANVTEKLMICDLIHAIDLSRTCNV